MDSVVIRGQQNFDKHDQLNPVKIKINDDRIINTFNKKNAVLINLFWSDYYSVAV